MSKFLKPDKVAIRHGLTINEKYIPRDARITKSNSAIRKGAYFRSQLKLKGPTSLTIHNTSAIVPAPGTTMSEQYARATYPNDNMGTVRVHYWVCPEEAWHQIPDTDVSWHAGKAEGNNTSLSMEIIGGSKQATENGALLAALILHDRGWGVDKLRTHNFWRGQPDYVVAGASKNCPLYILQGMGWPAFVALVQSFLDRIKTGSSGGSKPEPDLGFETHTVQDGEGTMAIARKRLGDASRYREIEMLNGLSGNYYLFPGQVLKLPTGAKPQPEPKPDPKPQPKPTAPAALQKATVKYGDRTDAVYLLQHALNLQNGAKLVLDGSFGPATRSAVRAYQTKHELTVDGIAGPSTWDRLLRGVR